MSDNPTGIDARRMSVMPGAPTGRLYPNHPAERTKVFRISDDRHATTKAFMFRAAKANELGSNDLAWIDMEGDMGSPNQTLFVCWNLPSDQPET